ncbi:phage virion morphogenesis protein [Rahnella perminowiae]|uniref:phage virion morphogenesis protein n=1 Tax=Rahnella perminowiae TaxID=2816244 RepID=UPI00224A7DB5|nr:phage virion morphogenesis protein [Rahnella perminowiae]MCX2946036.1 phage virion morphogenesis protein [Rahnella perminowiae]
MNTSIPKNDIPRLLRNLIPIGTLTEVGLGAETCRVNKGGVMVETVQVQSMAKMPQYGLRDRPSVRAKEMQYPARSLLGLDSPDMKIVEDELLVIVRKRKFI